MSNDIEFKAYKLLYEKKTELLSVIRHQARMRSEYGKPEESVRQLEVIGDSSLWDEAGIMNQGDIDIINVLEYLINDEETVIRKI